MHWTEQSAINLMQKCEYSSKHSSDLKIIGGNDSGQKACISIFGFPINRHRERISILMIVFVL